MYSWTDTVDDFISQKNDIVTQISRAENGPAASQQVVLHITLGP